MNDFDKTISDINRFRDARAWRQFHNPKDLALSLSLEASELLENFQWKTSEEAVTTNSAQIKDELADVLVYALMMCDDLGIDPVQAITDKLDKNHQKYPIDKAKGNKEKYNKL